jgi:hypothetical protein
MWMMGIYPEMDILFNDREIMLCSNIMKYQQQLFYLYLTTDDLTVHVNHTYFTVIWVDNYDESQGIQELI